MHQLQLLQLQRRHCLSQPTGISKEYLMKQSFPTSIWRQFLSQISARPLLKISHLTIGVLATTRKMKPCTRQPDRQFMRTLLLKRFTSRSTSTFDTPKPTSTTCMVAKEVRFRQALAMLMPTRQSLELPECVQRLKNRKPPGNANGAVSRCLCQ